MIKVTSLVNEGKRDNLGNDADRAGSLHGENHSWIPTSYHLQMLTIIG